MNLCQGAWFWFISSNSLVVPYKNAKKQTNSVEIWHTSTQIRDRYQGIAPERQLCKLCTLNVPEDEIHFLFQCPALSTTRVTFFQRFNGTHLEFGDDHFENMSNLLKKVHIVSMGLYAESLYKERQSIMYMWWSLKYVNKQHCPHCALPLSFISVLFWYIFIIIFIPVLEALKLN